MRTFPNANFDTLANAYVHVHFRAFQGVWRQQERTMADPKVLAMCLVVLGLVSLQAFGSPVESDGKMQAEYSKNWELMNELNVGGRLPVLKYRSKRTGLTVTIGKAESPIVNGYFCLATEAKTGDGLPHTLEHLVFLGRLVLIDTRMWTQF